MNCEQFRLQLMRDPDTMSDDMSAHMATCAVCQATAMQCMAMDKVLREAMAVEVPANLGQTVFNQKLLARRRASRGPLFALAATVLMGVGLATGVWLGRSQANDALGDALVAHVLHEPYLLEPSNETVSFERVGYVLSQVRADVRGDIGRVRHAGLCLFQGHKVPHLVVHTESGPVTVMLLPHESVKRVRSFEYGEFQGVIVPNGNGAIAIIGGDSSQLEPVRQQFQKAVEYSI